MKNVFILRLARRDNVKDTGDFAHTSAQTLYCLNSCQTRRGFAINRGLYFNLHRVAGRGCSPMSEQILEEVAYGFEY